MAYKLPPLSTLRVFEAAARHASFKAAADELLLTPSAVSRSVQTLEQWLGLALFVRGSRKLVLTEAGASYVSDIRLILDQLVRATAGVPGRGARGTLTISAAPTFGLRWLMPRLSRFKAKHPDIAITLDTTQRHVNFPRDAVDVAIRMGAGPWPDLEVLHLAAESLIPVCAPSVAEKIASVEDLASVPLLHVTSTTVDWDHWAAARGVTMPGSGQGLRFDTVQYALDAAAQGLGVAMGRRPVVNSDLERGLLVEVLGPAVASSISYWLVCAPRSLDRYEIKAFRNWIVGELTAEAT